MINNHTELSLKAGVVRNLRLTEGSSMTSGFVSNTLPSFVDCVIGRCVKLIVYGQHIPRLLIFLHIEFGLVSSFGRSKASSNGLEVGHMVLLQAVVCHQSGLVALTQRGRTHVRG